MAPKSRLSIGERIKRRREELGLTQDEVAKRVGYKSRSSVNKLELQRDIPSKKIEAFAVALETTPSYLMGWTDNPSRNSHSEADLLSNNIPTTSIPEKNVSEIIDLTNPKFSDLKTLVGRGKGSLTTAEKMELVKELLADEDINDT